MTLVSKPANAKRRPAEEISFGVGKTELGLILVGFSQKGIVYCQVGEDIEDLAQDLQRAFPQAMIVWRNDAHKKDVAKVIRLIDKPRGKIKFDVALDLRGSAFQKKVWNAIRTVPVGRVVTYGDIAHKIGSPRAARAVGSACANCMISFIIPCQRVLSKSGKSSGHWRISQHALIAREAG